MTRIWYAAYGSNLHRARLDVYLKGGVPEGATHAYPGCRDPSDPSAEMPWVAPVELAFGGRSKTWGGGVALVERGVDGDVTKMRLYLVERSQLEDIVAQENWLDPGTIEVDTTADNLELAGSMYGRVLRLGEVEGAPVFTVTQRAAADPAPPTVPYLAHIICGLREAHALSDDEIFTYLRSKRGVRGRLPDADLREAIAAGPVS